MKKNKNYKLNYREDYKTSDPHWWDEIPTALRSQVKPVLRWKKLDPDAQIPEYKSELAAGMDVRSNEHVLLKPSQRAVVGTGLSLAIPPGYEAQVRSRSGLAAKNGVIVANAPGTIDADYRGELKVILLNLSDEDFTVEKGDRIAQIVIAQCAHVENVEVEDLDETKRGDGGFGSTGIK